MNTITKILVTVGCVLIFIILFAGVVGTREAAGHKTPGIVGLVLFAALIGALRAIWKGGKKEDDKANDDSSILQK